MAKEIEFRIAPTGEMTVETFGMTGISCASAVNEIVATIGGTITDDKKKDSYYDNGPKVYNNGGVK